MKKLIVSFALVCLFSITACNTFQGAGRDLESLGGAMQGR